MTAVPLQEPAPRPAPARLVVEFKGPATRRTRAANRVLRVTAHPALRLAGRIASPATLRVANLSDLAGVLLPPPRGTRRHKLDLGKFKAEWVSGPNAAKPGPGAPAVLYFHGGGFVACGLRTHRRLVARISAASGAPVLNVAYRQLPKAPVPTSVADGVTAYRYLLSTGHDPGQIVLAGDSAGGLISFAIGIAAVQQGLPLPAGIVGLSPWLDLDCAGKMRHENVACDPYMSPQALDAVVRAGIARKGVLDEALSPVNADLTGLPEALIQVGSVEILRLDAETMADRLTEAGVPCRLQIWDQAPHVFQAGADVLPEARSAIADVGEFVRSACAKRAW